MYKNILHNPINVQDDEISALNQRRKMEKQLILSKDLNSADKCWYMISGDWLLQWKSFISNKVSSNLLKTNPNAKYIIRSSENAKIGILPPGPISNSDLLVKGANKDMTIKQNLKLNVDYRGVNKEVWDIFHRMYGGGPVL
jgi:hypothetical protein